MKKLIVLISVVAYLQLSSSLMSVREFESSESLRKCYDANLLDRARQILWGKDDQGLPLSNSIETFVSLVERYESLNPNDQVRDLIGKLLKSFRIDDLDPKIDEEIKLKDTSSSLHNKIKRLIFQVPETIQYAFNQDDFTNDEKCSLHFMLSHSVNDSRFDERDEVLENTNQVKHPREYGVVNLHSKKKHAFALGRVLLGIYAAVSASNSEDLTTILQRDKSTDDTLRTIKINPVYAVTLADLITRLIRKDEITFLPSGEWTDTSCPTEYKLDDNNGAYVTYSELRGAVDGLIIGRQIQQYRQDFANYKLSQILRQYYGYFGLVDPMRTRWCSRELNFQNVPDLENEMFNYYKLFKSMSDKGSIGQRTQSKIQNALSEIKSNIFKDIINEREECAVSELSLDRKFVSPRNIFAILDASSDDAKKTSFQIEVIGNFSSDFDLRPRGNLMGVYTNQKPLQSYTLDSIAKNSGIAGCPSCYAKLFFSNSRSKSKEDEAEIFKDLNDTFTHFDSEREELEQMYQTDTKEASPGKIVLYFNFGSNSAEQRVYDALWELKRHYRGVTILAIGDRRETLNAYVDNDQTDVFLQNSPKTIYDLKQRINKVPGEFMFRGCNHSSSSESSNKQQAFIPPNKIQYWAMYPQYFLKSYYITMTFKAQDGANIRVCFSRSYSAILEGGGYLDCKDSSGEIKFWTNNPCHKRNVFNCDPFYFSVEGKKQPTAPCQNLRCSTPNDIQFEFEHQGISCNMGNYLSISSIALLFAAFMFYVQRQ